MSTMITTMHLMVDVAVVTSHLCYLSKNCIQWQLLNIKNFNYYLAL